MLAPNWKDHDIETNRIVNYFADRQHTELILKKIEKKIETWCFYCKECENCNKLFQYREVFKQQGFWTLPARLNTGMYMTQTGVKETNFSNLCQLEISNLRCKSCYFFKEINKYFLI